jgi:GH15 family glucan-1,4-alpha-glucosidase
MLISILVCSGLSANTACPGEEKSQIAVSAPGASGQIQTHSPLVTGNGFGYAVVATTGNVTRLYAHPYRFERPNTDITKDGPSTANFLKNLQWRTGSQKGSELRVFYPDMGSNSARSIHPSVSYLAQSQVISVQTPGIEDLYFMPFGLKHNTLVAMRRLAKAAAADGQRGAAITQSRLCPVWEHAVEKEETKHISGVPVRVLTFRDVKECLALVPLSKGGVVAGAAADRRAAVASGDSASGTVADGPAENFSKENLPGDTWAFVVLEKPDDAEMALKDLFHWQNGDSGDLLIERELKALESWRITPNVHFASDKERQLWRQNETILRMAQIEEKNQEGRVNHGLILASLPDGVWFTPWVRDMSYALVALVRMGHTCEAREGIIAWFNARPVGRWRQDTRGLDYQISVTRYYGDGSEESDYSGQKTENCEFDDWGLALWAIAEYWQKTHDQSLLSEKTYRGGTVYESMRDFVVKPLLGNLDSYGDGLIVAEDSSCWEEHQENKRHYACSTIAAIPGLRGFLKIAEAMHDEATVKLVGEKLAMLERGFKSAFVKDGFVRGVVETDTQPKSEVDGAVLETFNFDIVNDPAITEKTLAKMELLKTASGGYRRNQGPSNYEAHEFLLIDFNLARVYFKLGKFEEGTRILETLVDKSCQDHGLIAEMYLSAKGKDWDGEIGDPAGAIPMVGFGAGDYVITLVDREKYKPEKFTK